MTLRKRIPATGSTTMGVESFPDGVLLWIREDHADEIQIQQVHLTREEVLKVIEELQERIA